MAYKDKRKAAIISASRRTDIPAFYSEWFINRIRAGYCVVLNPFNPKQLSRISLKPQDVLAIVFWTRNTKPLIKYLRELDIEGYKYYFQYTIIGYPDSIDPKSPPVKDAIAAFKYLSGLIGRDRVIWRYDPILFSDEVNFDWHIAQISYLMEELKVYTNRMVISFIDPYRKTKIRMDKGTVFDPPRYRNLAEWIGKESAKAGLQVQTCAEEPDLDAYGISHGKCIDDILIKKITGIDIAKKKDPGQRKLCGCVVSKDIGMNNTCLSGCSYCYATSGIKTAENNYKRHDKNSASII